MLQYGMTTGIHHITAIASNAKHNLQFYTKTLGLRLVKKTVNQDDVSTYHLFYGGKTGHPGMDLTFFIFLPPSQGLRGNGQVTNISLSVPDTSMDFWKERFTKLKVKHDKVSERFGNKRIRFYDEDNQQLELVGVTSKKMEKDSDIWTTEEVAKDHAIRSFHSATLSVHSKMLVDPILLHVFEYKAIAHEEDCILYELPGSKRAHYLEVQEDLSKDFGINAAGTVHHIAFRAKDEKHQQELAKRVTDLGIQTTEVINRFYFKSVYFRTPAGILFEIATDEPGFTADEKIEDLGKHLALPPFLEGKRQQIEEQLIPLDTE